MEHLPEDERKQGDRSGSEPETPQTALTDGGQQSAGPQHSWDGRSEVLRKRAEIEEERKRLYRERTQRQMEERKRIAEQRARERDARQKQAAMLREARQERERTRTEEAARQADMKPERRAGFWQKIGRVLAGFVIASVTATEAMMFILFGRTTPVVKEPFLPEAWAKEQGMTWREVSFLSGDVKLRGFTLSPARPQALILLVHGVRSSSDVFAMMIPELLEENWAVMSFDGTASGRSEGERVIGLQQQCQDLRAALQVLRDDPELSALPLVLLGHSAGAYAAAAEGYTSGARAVVCASGFNAPLDTMQYWAKHYTGPVSYIEYPFLFVREHMMKGSQANLRAAERLADTGLPAFVIQSDNDDVIPMEISLYQAVRERNNGRTRFRLVTDPLYRDHGHVLGNEDGPNGMLLQEIVEFIRDNLPQGSGF